MAERAPVAAPDGVGEPIKTGPDGDTPASAAESTVAVVDIGSNSVRLVVFNADRRVPRVLFNEKTLCGLGNGLAETGRLNPDGRALAERTVTRFLALGAVMGVGRWELVATAAMRDAEDGPAFAERLFALTGLEVRVISGAEEGRLSALGVLSGIPDADGIVGDLGGGSLELARVRRGAVEELVSLPLGPQRLPRPDEPRHSDNVAYIDKKLRKVRWLVEQGKEGPFYAVGGAWRSLARVHIAQSYHPLHMIHQYAVPRDEAMDLTRLIALQSRKSALKLPGVSRRRADSLPAAAQVLGRALKASEARQVVFSAFGLREGLLYDALLPADRAKDPLLEMCREIGDESQRQPGFGDALARWIGPAFPDESPARARLRQAACLAADIAWRQHPDYRASHARDAILRTPFAGIDHTQRAFLALALWVRYGAPILATEVEPLLGLLDDDDRRRCEVLGTAMRLGVALSGGAPALLDRAGLGFDGGSLMLDTRSGPELAAETVDRRLAAVARAMGNVPYVILTE